MGSAGLEWDATDMPEATRLNQKTRFVGTGSQINALTTTYPGQEAFCTSTGSGFTVDTLYIRNSANTTWNQHQQFATNLALTSEANTTPVTDNADFTVTAGHRYYAYFTLPSTEKFYQITGIEWKNGATVAGSVISGIDYVYADPPTNAEVILGAIGQVTSASGASSVQRVSTVLGHFFPASTVLGVWVSCSSSSHTLREQTGLSSQNQSKATSYTTNPGLSESTAWTATTARKYLKVYYKGYY